MQSRSSSDARGAPALTQMTGKVNAEIMHIVFSAMDEARFATAHEIQAECIEAGCRDDAAIMPKTIFVIENGHV